MCVKRSDAFGTNLALEKICEAMAPPASTGAVPTSTIASGRSWGIGYDNLLKATVISVAVVRV